MKGTQTGAEFRASMHARVCDGIFLFQSGGILDFTCGKSDMTKGVEPGDNNRDPFFRRGNRLRGK